MYKNPLPGNKPISGKFGKVYHDGEWLVNVTGCEASINLEYADVDLLGDLWTKKKLIGINGEGSLKTKKVTSKFLQLMQDTWENGKSLTFDLMVVLDDPSSYGTERIMLNEVTFTKIPVASQTGKELIDQELPFNFTGMQIIDAIETTEVSTF